MSYYSRARTDLTAAVAKGIITPEQLPLLITHFEERRGFFSKITLAQWLAAAGGIFIAIGIILIIAFNWDKLGNFVKIFAYLVLLGGMGWGFCKSENRPVLRNILGLAWFFLPAAGIGLYAQIFQLSGTPVRPYLLWAALASPIALWGGGKMYSRLLSVLLLGILFYGTYEPSSVFYLCLKKNVPNHVAELPLLQSLSHWTAALALMAAALGINFYKKDMWSIPVAAALAWIICLLFHDNTALYTSNYNLAMAAVMASSLLLFFYKIRFNSADIVNNGLRILVVVLYMLSFLHGKMDVPGTFFRAGDMTLGTAAALIIILSAAWIMLKTEIFPEHGKADTAIKAVFILSILAPVLPSAINASSFNMGAAIANILLVAIGAILLWAGSFYGSKGKLHTGMFIIVAIAITRFLDLFATQLTSGMAFLLTGGIFAFAAWWISRGATRMAEMSSVKNTGNNSNTVQETGEARK